MHILGNYVSFSVLVLRKVRENSWNRSTFSLLLEKPNYKNPRRFLYRVGHTKFVLLLKCNTFPCSIFRGSSSWNVVMTCARCGKLCTVYNGIFSATPQMSGVKFKNMNGIWLVIWQKNKFEFGHKLAEILPHFSDCTDLWKKTFL